MKAFFIDRYKSKVGLRFGDMPNPELRDDDVMVQVYAAGVNLLDAKIKDGEFKLFLHYRLPLVLGNDVAGSWFGSDQKCGASRPATRSMHGHVKIASVPSQNSLQ
jgi:D-arabinose 1-dehydrogenase-like Zn-dependent alcohol dehydrogenase